MTNQVQDGILDKTTYSKRIPRDRQAIHQLVEDLGLVDIWRLINPREKEFTFFSHKHKSASRIDYFLLSKTMIDSCTDSKIGVIALTDHATVMLDMLVGEEFVKSSRWRCNTSLFQDPGFKDMLDENIKSFCQINTGSIDKFSTV